MLARWTMSQESAHPEPFGCVCQIPEFITEDQLSGARLPVRRLAGYSDIGDLGSWAKLVSHAVGRVLAPKSDRWIFRQMQQRQADVF